MASFSDLTNLIPFLIRFSWNILSGTYIHTIYEIIYIPVWVISSTEITCRKKKHTHTLTSTWIKLKPHGWRHGKWAKWASTFSWKGGSHVHPLYGVWPAPRYWSKSFQLFGKTKRILLKRRTSRDCCSFLRITTKKTFMNQSRCPFLSLA